MVKITGNFGKVKSWINRLIRTKASGNLFVGEDTGKITTGDYNTFVGYQAGYLNTTGERNCFTGYQAGYLNTTGNYNNFMGNASGRYNTTGYSNTFMGYRAGYSTTTGHSNNFMGNWTGYSNTTGHSSSFTGHNAGYSNTTGHSNSFVGYQAGYTNITGVQNVYLGLKAGYYETGNNTLFIDNAPRTDEADGRIKALIYGLFAAATANQLLRINGILELTEISDYADNAAAITGGLTTGQVYRNGDSLNIVH